MDQLNKKIAEKVLWEIAANSGLTLEELKANLQETIEVGFAKEDSNAKSNWRKIPCEGDIPTPEEVIIYIAEKVLQAEEEEDV